MSIARIPVQVARDRQAVAAYLRDLATNVVTGRVACDPYAVVVVLIGPEDIDIGSRNIIIRNDYRRVIRGVLHRLRDHAYGPVSP